MNLTLWANVDSLSDASRLSESDFARLIGLEEEKFRTLRLKKADLPLDVAARISETFQVDLFILLAGKVDHKAAERFFHKAPIELPERYRDGQFSKLRSVLNLLDGVRIQRGDAYLENLMRHSQIPKGFFDDPEKMINVRFLTDLTQLLVDRGWSEQQLFALGQHSFQTHRSSAFGTQMAKYKSWKNVYENLVNVHAAAFDRNYDYRLQSCTKDRVVIDAIPRDEVCAALRTLVFDSESTCLTRMGVMSTVSCYISGTASRVTKLKSVHEGDGFNRYEIRPSADLMLS